jgi:predicted amidohydrolase
MLDFSVMAVQMNALKEDIPHNLEMHMRFIAKASDAGCKLVVFPELSVTAHYGEEGVVRSAQRLDGDIAAAMQAAAEKHHIVVGYGFCELAHGTYYNSHALVGPQGVLGVQRKVHASFDEYFHFRMGRSLEVFDLGFCKIGTLICFDQGFCEAWRCLALKGAEVVLLPSAGRTGWGEQIPEETQKEQLVKRLEGLPGAAGVHAAENGVFAVSCNQVGFNGHSTHGGGAYIVNPLGELLAKSEPVLDDVSVVTLLDPGLLDQARQSPHHPLKTRRPELYGELTRMI